MKQREDSSHGMQRVEVICSICESVASVEQGSENVSYLFCVNEWILNVLKFKKSKNF